MGWSAENQEFASYPQNLTTKDTKNTKEDTKALLSGRSE